MLPTRSHLQVWIGTERSPTTGFGAEKPYVILIRASYSRERKLRSTYKYELHQGPSRDVITGEVFLGLLPGREGLIDRHFAAGDELPIPAEKYHEFYTMHPNMQAYRNVVTRLRVRQAHQFLVAMNDLVAIKNVTSKRSILEKAVATRLFMTEFLRESETFFAYYNADSILRGLREERLDRISNALHLKFKLPTFQNEHEIPIQFNVTPPIPKRMFVIIGKNGTGKSRSMYHFADSLLNNDDRLRTWDGERPRVNRLLAVCSPGETHRTFPPPHRSKHIRYLRVMLGREKRSSGAIGLGEAVIRLLRSEESIKEVSRWDIFLKAVWGAFPGVALFVPMTEPQYPLPIRRVELGTLHDRRRQMGTPIPLTQLKSGTEAECLERWGRVNIEADLCRCVDGQCIPLSSGQITFLRFAAQVSLFIENGTFVLVDEPETHLHPNLVTQFVRLLNRLLEATGSYAVLATHSAYFVREVPKTHVAILYETDPGYIEVSAPRLRTLGADVGAISAFVFQEEPFGGVLQDLAQRIRAGKQSPVALINSISAELPAEAEMFLRQASTDEAPK